MSLEEKLNIAIIETSAEKLDQRLYVAFCMYNLNLVNRILVSGRKGVGVAEKFFKNWRIPLSQVIWEKDSNGIKESIKNTLHLLCRMRGRVGRVYYIVNHEHLRDAEAMFKKIARKIGYKPDTEFQSLETSISYTSLWSRSKRKEGAYA